MLDKFKFSKGEYFLGPGKFLGRVTGLWEYKSSSWNTYTATIDYERFREDMFIHEGNMTKLPDTELLVRLIDSKLEIR